MENTNVNVSNIVHREIVDRVRSIVVIQSESDINNWIVGGDINLDLCFVADYCPREYRDDLLEIIIEVENKYYL